ncbi:MAG TPA: hypothetical protein VF701_00765 [Thermoanaerobaculia bacterium]
MSTALGRLLVILVVVATVSLSAQTIQHGEIVHITNRDGLQVSAVPRETLGFSPNRSAWEQWQYVSGGHLRSYHGTMLVNDRALLHAPSKISDPTLVRLAGVRWSGSQYSYSELVNGGECLLAWNDGSLPYWWVSTNSGMVGYILQMNQIPNGTAFRCHTVASPQMPRQPEQLATSDGTSVLKSWHNTYVGAVNPKSGVITTAAHGPSGTAGLNWNVMVGRDLSPNTNGDRFLKVGDRVRAVINLGGGHYLTMKPSGARADTGLEQVSFAPGNDPYWTIVADGFANGNRLPKGTRIYLRSGSNTNLTSDPARPAVQLSPNGAAWETWVLGTP